MLRRTRWAPPGQRMATPEATSCRPRPNSRMGRVLILKPKLIRNSQGCRRDVPSPHMVRTSGQRSRRESAVTRHSPNTLAVAAINRSAASSWSSSSRLLEIATSEVNGTSRTLRAASRIQVRGFGDSVMRPFSASRTTSQKLTGDTRGGSDAVESARLTEAGSRSGSLTPQSHTWVSSRNGN